MHGLIALALRRRVLVVVMLAGVLVAGAISFANLNIEAYPDPVPPLVDVVTQWPGQSAEEIERYVTIPIEVALASIPHVTAVRTSSLFGLSDVKVQFTYDYTYEEAEQKVLNHLSQLSPLPGNITPSISPESPTGEVYRYRLKGPPGFSLTDLKSLQDWVVDRRFRAVPGVIDVTGWGGRTKTYDVTIDLAKLQAYNLTLTQVLQALGNSNINVGGQILNVGPQAAVVRGVGLIRSMSDIANTVVTQNNNVPVLISDVATVSVGHVPRLGIAGQDAEDDVVQGIVLMRRGSETLPTLKKIEAAVAKMNSEILPPGVRLEPYYDRTDLINVTTHTVLHNVAFGIILVFLVQWLFLGSLRSAIVVATTIPFALSFALIVMMIRGESANLLSVGAVDFGLIVDGSVIMVENVFRHLVESRHGSREPHSLGWEIDRVRDTLPGMPIRMAIIHAAGTEVAVSIFFSTAIIVAAFVPLFGLGGIEGHIFSPMAKTYAYALLGAVICTFTVSPALCALLLPEDLSEKDTIVVRLLHAAYEPVLRFAVANRILTLGAGVLLIVLSVLAGRSLQLEFLPKLEEGNLWIRATMPISISLEEGNGYVNRMRALMLTFPEVVTVVSQHGRPDDGTDTAGFYNAEFYVPLKPPSEWPKGLTKDEFTKEVIDKLQADFPGIDFNASQNIQDNVEEAASGVKGENSVKVFGSDLKQLEATAHKIKDVLSTVRGITDLAVLTTVGQPTVTIDVDRHKAARYGLMPGDVNAVVQAAIGGQTPGDLYEVGSDRHFPIMVRLAPSYRQDLDSIRNITIGAQGPNGQIQVPLSEVATVKLTSGPAFIYREQQQRYVPIKYSVRGRDVGSAILEAQKKVAESVVLPAGTRLEWVGEIENLQDAMARLKILVPTSMALILLLLYGMFGTVRNMLLAASVIPMALVGGIFTLVLTGTPFSVSAAIGFVALFGISVMEGVILLSFFRRIDAFGHERRTAIIQTGMTRLRPVVMTCFAACVGLLPAAVSTGIGSQVQRPLALVVVGGILLAPALILIFLPVMIDVFTPIGAAQPIGDATPEPGE
ncbi:MAG: efflux RND transporter permease subunit [Methylocella sp.]